MDIIHRQKTETASKIPILPVTQMIIDTYANHPKSNNEDKLLPVLSNQKMNAYLKEIAGVCEIEKELTFPYCPTHFCNDCNAYKWGSY